MVVLTINNITVEIPDLKKTGALCAAMVERLGGRGRCDNDGQEQDSTPVPWKLSAPVQIKKRGR